MAQILIIYHTQTGNTEKMAKAVASGAGSVENTSVVLKMAGDATLEDFVSCDGIAIGSPEYFGYMAGMIKDFFDRTYEKAREAPEVYRKPYVLFISAGNDRRGARDQIERICIGYSSKKFHESLIARGDIDEEILKKATRWGKQLLLAAILAFTEIDQMGILKKWMTGNSGNYWIISGFLRRVIAESGKVSRNASDGT